MSGVQSPLKAIREKCLDCCCGFKNEIRLCNIKNCALYPFRFGHNPYKKKKEYTDEELEVLKERLKMARQSRQK